MALEIDFYSSVSLTRRAMCQGLQFWVNFWISSVSVLSEVSASSSSIVFGGGVVAIVHPIQAPMSIIARKAMRTTAATVQNCKVCGGIDNSSAEMNS